MRPGPPSDLDDARDDPFMVSKLDATEPLRSADHVVSLRELKKLRTRSELAQVTVELVRQHGIEHVRVNDICRQAEVGRSTFFRYFESKEAAFVDGVLGDRLQAILLAVAARPKEETAFEVLHVAFLEVHRDWAEQRETLLLTAQIRRSSAQVQAWAAMQGTQWTEELARSVAARFSGTNPLLRARLLAGAAVSSVSITTDHWLDEGAQTSPEPLVELAFELLRRLDEA